MQSAPNETTPLTRDPVSTPTRWQSSPTGSINEAERLPRSRSEILHATSYGTLHVARDNASWFMRSPASATERTTSKWVNSSLMSLPERKSIPSYFNSLRRRPSTYDAPLVEQPAIDDDENAAEKVNGIRVWYSSFQSIDWLHDAVRNSIAPRSSSQPVAKIKDLSRVRRLRRRKSIRGQILNALDRATGWFVVSLVGFLSAVAAYLILKSERWLFDLKVGYCTAGWWKAYAVCCQGTETPLDPQDHCPLWENWDSLFHSLFTGNRGSGWPNWFIEYASYTIVAVSSAYTFS